MKTRYRTIVFERDVFFPERWAGFAVRGVQGGMKLGWAIRGKHGEWAFHCFDGVGELLTDANDRDIAAFLKQLNEDGVS